MIRTQMRITMDLKVAAVHGKVSYDTTPQKEPVTSIEVLHNVRTLFPKIISLRMIRREGHLTS
jgi:hypothetical protein